MIRKNQQVRLPSRTERTNAPDSYIPTFEREDVVADRTRVRIEGYDSPTNLPTYTQDNETGEFTSTRTVDIPETAPRLRQRIVDCPTWPVSKEKVDNDCQNWRRRVLERGFVPEFRLPSQDLYVVIKTSLDQTEYVPTLSLLPQAMSALPEVFSDPRLKLYLERKGVESWHQATDGWKGPKLSLYSGFSLLNFLREVPEALGTCRSYLSKGGLADRWSALMGRNQSLPERARAVANERLAYKYGTELLIQDAKKLHSIITGWKSKADALFEHMGTVQKSRRPPDGNGPRGEDDQKWSKVPFAYLGMPNASLVVDTHYEWGCNQTLAWNYTMRNLKRGLSRLFQLMDSLGIRADAGIIWDAIPYSFVIDWFFNVGTWLHQNWSREWIETEVKLLSMCNSAHVKKVDRVYLEQFGEEGENLYFDQLLFDVDTEYYWRKKAELPSFKHSSVQNGSDPWPVPRIINATALLTQVILKRRNVTARLRELKKQLGSDVLKESLRDAQKAWRKIDDFVMKAPLRDARKRARQEKAVERAVKQVERTAIRLEKARRRAVYLNKQKLRSKQTTRVVKLPRGNPGNQRR